MKNHVTIIPEDSLIIVDNEALIFPFVVSEDIHAIQWHEGQGWVEYKGDAPNKDAVYEQDVAPYVRVWQAEKDRLQAIADKEAQKPPPSLHDQAMLLSMPKLDFVEMAEALTASMPNPVTWASINEWMTTNPEIQKLFILATDVRRDDPKLDAVTAQFGTEFLPFLDMMFVFKNEIQAEMALAKEQNRPINLDALLAVGD